MAVTVYLEGSQTCVSTTEHTLTANPETEAGAFQVFLDLNDLTSGENLTIKVYEKVRDSSGTQRVVWQDFRANVQGVEKIWASPVLMLINGWRVTITATGTPVIPWDIRKG